MQLFSEFQDILRCQDSQKIVNHYVFFYTNQSWTSNRLSFQYYQSKVNSGTMNCHNLTVHDKHTKQRCNENMNSHMLTHNKRQYQDIYTRWLKFQDNFRNADNLCTILKFQEFLDCWDPWKYDTPKLKLYTASSNTQLQLLHHYIPTALQHGTPYNLSATNNHYLHLLTQHMVW